VYATVGGSLRRLLQAFVLAPWIRKTSKKNIRVVVLKPNKDLKYVNEIYEAGKLKPVIDGPYKLDQVQDAFRLFEKGKHKGKIVIKIE
jgi:NADPH:quinone reductase-like Zn-dependent oxidoreductase